MLLWLSRSHRSISSNINKRNQMFNLNLNNNTKQQQVTEAAAAAAATSLSSRPLTRYNTPSKQRQPNYNKV